MCLWGSGQSFVHYSLMSNVPPRTSPPHPWSTIAGCATPLSTWMGCRLQDRRLSSARDLWAECVREHVREQGKRKNRKFKTVSRSKSCAGRREAVERPKRKVKGKLIGYINLRNLTILSVLLRNHAFYTGSLQIHLHRPFNLPSIWHANDWQ